MRKRGFLLALVCSGLFANSAAYSQYDEYGGHRRATRHYPRVAGSASGEFMVVWGDMDHVYARRYSSSGNPLGEEIVVDKGVATRNREPADVKAHCVSMDDQGNAVVAWESSGEFQEIHVRFFDRAGRVTSELTEQDKMRPVVSMSPRGGFALAYYDMVEGRVFVWPFSGEGKPVRDALQINGARARSWQADVGLNAAGDLAVVCEGASNEGGLHISAFKQMAPVFDRAISSAGVQSPAVAIDSHGKVAVAWQAKAADAPQPELGKSQIMLGILGPEGPSALGREPLRVNLEQCSDDADPDVIFDEKGDVVVVYSARKGLRRQIFSRKYSLAKNTANDPRWITEGALAAFENKDPSIANLANGSYVVAWETDHVNDKGKFDHTETHFGVFR